MSPFSLGILGSAHVTASGPVYYDEVMADSPILYWRLGEASGTTATDASGNARHGTYGTTGITLGQTGLIPGDPAPTFQNTSAPKVTLASAAWMNAYPLTVELMFRQTTSTPGAEHTLIARHKDGDVWDVLVVDGQLKVRHSGPFVNATPEPTITLNTTYHLAFTLTSTGSTVYLQGASVASHSRPYASNSNALTVGVKQIVNHGQFIGTIDEVAVYSGTLPAARILTHAQAAGVA